MVASRPRLWETAQRDEPQKMSRRVKSKRKMSKYK